VECALRLGGSAGTDAGAGGCVGAGAAGGARRSAPVSIRGVVPALAAGAVPIELTSQVRTQPVSVNGWGDGASRGACAVTTADIMAPAPHTMSVVLLMFGLPRATWHDCQSMVHRRGHHGRRSGIAASESTAAHDRLGRRSLTT
jgi:hypothetical protein